MPRKNAMRDNVNAVRSRLPHLSDLSREKIELALLYYETNVDETVDAFNRNGAIEALSGWTEMNNSRGNHSDKRPYNKSRNTNNKSLTSSANSSLQIPSSSGILRPSQRVSNIFQTFAEGGIPTATVNENTPSPPETITTTTTTVSSPTENILNHDLSVITNDVIVDQPTEQPKPQRRKSVKSRNGSASTQNHEPVTTTVTKSLPSNNKKLLTKSVKDLQRQTSTLTNVELLFNNEIKSSVKRIDDVFKQLHEILKEREIELYLQMDKAKEYGLNVIHRRQQRAIELRQRIDRCDRLEPLEIDHLRMDIKQFVTDRRYELGEELTSSHRFEYDQTLIESLKNFGNVLKIDRKSSTTTSNIPIEKSISDVTPEKIQISVTPSVSDEAVINEDDVNTSINDNITGDNHQNFYSLPQTNGYLQYYNGTNDYQNMNRRRPQQYFHRPRPLLNYQNGSNRRNIPKQMNGRVNIYNNNETTNTYHRPRPSPPSIVQIQT